MDEYRGDETTGVRPSAAGVALDCRGTHRTESLGRNSVSTVEEIVVPSARFHHEAVFYAD
jgi:hypothetical protein